VAKKPGNKKEVNTNEWINTYADTVTLLLCFFVLLFSFSTINEAKWEAIVKAFAMDDNVTIDPDADIDIEHIVIPDTSDPLDDTDENDTSTGVDEEGDIKTKEDLLYERIKKYIKENDLEANVETFHDNGEVRIRFTDLILFNPDRAELLEKGKVILSGLCVILNDSIDMIDMIEIQGHTASDPRGEHIFTRTFEFSTERALNVLRYAINHEKLDPHKISAIGYGQYHPIADNNTPEGMAANRRVEVVVISNEAASVSASISDLD